MSIIEVFLERNCTPEQSSLLSDCFRTIREYGMVEIDYNLDEIFQRIEHLETYDVIQNCYGMIQKLQYLILDELELKVELEAPEIPNDILGYIKQLEESKSSSTIVEIIDNAESPLDAFLALLEGVCYADLTSIEPTLLNVSTAFIERIYKVHHSTLMENIVLGVPVKAIDSRILEILNKLWEDNTYRLVKDYVKRNELNLPLSDATIHEHFDTHLLELSTSSDKKFIATVLLELALVSDTEYKDLKDKIKSFSKKIFGKDMMMVTEMNYHIDNVCMENKINGSY